MCRDWVKISTVRENCTPEASFKNHRGNILHSHYIHNDDINTCVRNQQDYTLGLSSGWRKRLRVRMCEGGKKRETIWLSCICGSYICSNAIGLPMNHFACLFVGWSQLDIKHPDTESEGSFFRELRGNVSVSPLKPCICIINEMWREWSWVCLHGGESIFVHSLHVTGFSYEC